jgi:hypothetical protein
MFTSKHIDIITQIGRYVRGELPRADYRAWLVDRVWEAERLEDEELERLFYQLEALDAEFTSCVWNEDELKAELQNRYLQARAFRSSA